MGPGSEAGATVVVNARKTNLSRALNNSGPTGKSPQTRQAPFDHDILIFRNGKSVYILCHVIPLGGAFRERHEMRDGLWWVVAARETGDAKADGQVVWS